MSTQRLILSILLIVISFALRAQVNVSDTSAGFKYSRTYYVPRLSASFQKSPLLEFGICRQWTYQFESYEKTNGWNGKNSSAYFGTYLSAEAVLTNEKPIYGLKFGAETVLIGGASTGIVLGLEATNYFYKSQHYLGATPKLVIPITRNATPLAFLSYGYCFNDFNSLSTYLGNHRFSFIFNFCLKEHKKINSMFKEVHKKADEIKAKN